MKILLKLTALVLGLSMLSGCGQNEIGEKQAFSPNVVEEESQKTEPEEQKAEVLQLAGDYDSLVVSPWNCPDLNTRKMASLLYDSVVKLGPDFKAVPFLAQVSGEGSQWEIIPKENVFFTDGSPLTAKDIDRSLTLALEEGSYYRNRLENISEHRVSGNKVQVTLKEPDALFANLLTFPIAKPDKNNQYIGTGRYQFVKREENSVFLEKNPQYSGEKPSIEQIELKSLTKKGVASYSLKLGEIDCLYTEENRSDISTLSTGDYPVVKNQIIFLGANNSRGHCSNAVLRKILNQGIDREMLVQAAISSAVPASLPMHPNFYPSNQEAVKGRSVDDIRKMLTDSEIIKEGGSISLRLLYCSDTQERAKTANQIAAQLHQAGIEIKLEGKPEKEYFSALESGNYDLYLGEVLLGDDMSLRHLLMRGEHCGYGVVLSEKLLASYQTAFSGGNWDDFVKNFAEESPVIPLAFRSGTLSFSREYAFPVTATASDLFYNIDSWQ